MLLLFYFVILNISFVKAIVNPVLTGVVNFLKRGIVLMKKLIKILDLCFSFITLFYLFHEFNKSRASPVHDVYDLNEFEYKMEDII